MEIMGHTISQEILDIEVGDALKAGDLICAVESVDLDNLKVKVEGQPEIGMLHLQNLIVERKAIEIIKK